MNSLPCITLNRHAFERARRRHPWVFSNELADPRRFQQLEPGALVDVLDHRGGYLGTGFVNPKSLIAVRILSRLRGEEIGARFFRERIERALDIRDPLYGPRGPSGGTYRACFGEGDGLPGLIVDRFEGAWVIEPHALGMERRIGLIAEQLRELARERYGQRDPWLVVRTDHRAAQLEGLAPGASSLSGTPCNSYAIEHGLRFPVDPLAGQKTGFFFDQRENRASFRRWAEARSAEPLRVLDVFCHAGAWGLGALQAGAAEVSFIDSSAPALETVRLVAGDMGMEGKIRCIQGDALEALRGLPAGQFDLVALDPPALIPSKKDLAAGQKLYRELNRESLRLLRARGGLSTSSCSYHLQEERFEEQLLRALLESGREGRVLFRGGAGPDHPMLPGMSEGRYLKNCFIAL